MPELRENLLKHLMHKVAVKENLENPTYEFATGLNKKDGFVSTMFHVKLNGISKSDKSKKILHLLIKFAPANEQFRTELPLNEAFRRETYFYETIVPLMEKMLEKANMIPRLEYIGQFFGASLEEYNEAIIFENLRHSKYELWDYKKPMNYDHIRFVLERYGQFHANGYALKFLYPEIFKEKIATVKKNFLFEEDCSKFLELMEDYMGIIAEGLHSNEDADVLKALLKHKEVVKRVLQGENADDEYFTLVHGDCWCNNLMFAYVSSEHYIF